MLFEPSLKCVHFRAFSAMRGGDPQRFTLLTSLIQSQGLARHADLGTSKDSILVFYLGSELETGSVPSGAVRFSMLLAHCRCEADGIADIHGRLELHRKRPQIF